MSSPPQQDPYLALGLSKDADITAIKSAYRKLVLKCHPDKIQDPALKAAKQDEFQKVQQAYELLSDDTRRTRYDEQMKLYELRKEMGRGGPPPGHSPFDYEVKTAEPRASTFKSSPKETQRPYAPPPQRTYDEEPRAGSFDESQRAKARKTTTYEERRRPATRDGERSRRSDEDRDYERWEKERERAMHGAAKKNRDKERRRGAEEKFSRAYVEDDDSDDGYRPRTEAKSSRGQEESNKARERWVRAAEKLSRKEREIDGLTERTKKIDLNTIKAVQYMQAAKRKVEQETDSRPKPARRSESSTETPYKVRYAVPPSPYMEDDDSPRRSSAARIIPTRRVSEQSSPPSRSSAKERRSSPYDRDPYIVEASPPSPPEPPRRKPPLQSHTSEPPILPSATRKQSPLRSKTLQSEFVRRESTTAPPPLPRASTFQAGDKTKFSTRGSNLKKQMHYNSDGSDSEDYSPRASSRREPLETTRRYVFEKGRTVPVEQRYRSDLREDWGDTRDRSESPRGTRRSTERPALSRSGGSGTHHSSYSRGYSSQSPEPIIKEARPKMPPRESHATSSNRGTYFGEVKYAPQYGPEHVYYSGDGYRRGSDPTHHRDFSYPPRPTRETVYA